MKYNFDDDFDKIIEQQSNNIKFLYSITNIREKKNKAIKSKN